MFTFFLIIHFVLAILMILLIVIQKKDSDGGAIGFGGGSSGAFTPRGEANILTKGTYILASLFFINCVVIAKLVDHNVDKKGSLLKNVIENTDVEESDNSKVPESKNDTVKVDTESNTKTN